MHKDNSTLAFTATGATLLDVTLTYNEDPGVGFWKVIEVDKFIWEVREIQKEKSTKRPTRKYKSQNKNNEIQQCIQYIY